MDVTVCPVHQVLSDSLTAMEMHFNIGLSVGYSIPKRCTYTTLSLHRIKGDDAAQ